MGCSQALKDFQLDQWAIIIMKKVDSITRTGTISSRIMMMRISRTSKMIMMKMMINQLSFVRSTALRMEQYIEVNGKVLNVMASACKSGQMELVMRVNGEGTKHMVEASSGMWMEMFSMACGKMTKPMEKEFIHTLMVPSMMGTGRMTYSMGMGLRLGLMVPVTKATIKRVRSMAKEVTSGVTVQGTLGIGMTIR